MPDREISKQQIVDFMNAHDKNKDGKISKEEFLQYLKEFYQ